jgi:hypothetical protein
VSSGSRGKPKSGGSGRSENALDERAHDPERDGAVTAEHQHVGTLVESIAHHKLNGADRLGRRLKVLSERMRVIRRPRLK